MEMIREIDWALSFLRIDANDIKDALIEREMGPDTNLFLADFSHRIDIGQQAFDILKKHGFKVEKLSKLHKEVFKKFEEIVDSKLEEKMFILAEGLDGIVDRVTSTYPQLSYES